MKRPGSVPALLRRPGRPGATGPPPCTAPVAEGVLLAPVRTLAGPANRVRAALTAEVPTGAAVGVQVRGWQGTGWTESRSRHRPGRLGPTGQPGRAGCCSPPAPKAPPPGYARSSSPSTVAVATPTPAAGVSYRVFATREGEVGGVTANGHTIQPRDHFVALPSRRGLSPINTGDYTVRVCTTSGSRCEYAPVWDVGPWNTRDDYWNPAAVRENWKDLPQGRPEAQAAYQYGYHGGKDQFGRTVLQPGRRSTSPTAASGTACC